MTRSARVLIVEDCLEEYRRRFFELLHDSLADRSVRLSVAIGAARADMEFRRAEGAPLPFVHHVAVRSLPLAIRRLAYKSVVDLAADSELVVAEQALRHLETYRLLRIARRHRRPKVALWGHGVRRVKAATSLERRLERRLTRSADWFFAYTKRGAEDVVAAGFPRERVTVVQNTADVAELAAARREISTDEVSRLREELDLPTQNVCLFIGALDASKRLGFLLQACSLVARRLPDFTLVVAGDGEERALVEAALASSPWLRYVGRSTGHTKACLGAASDVLLMPGRVGLVAVDSFALETPIVTTTWPFHAPEVEYLEDGVNARFTRDSVTSYAEAVEELLVSRDELVRLKTGCATAVPRYSLETMVSNFTTGVMAALEASVR
jgi:glycosyltransferase involved in cell wall biosynthesis